MIKEGNKSSGNGSSGVRIIFMGSPEFAVSSLDALIRAGLNIVAVITAPDRPAGRGMQPTSTAVKKYALEAGLRLLQPEKLKNPFFLDELKALKADLQVVVAFRMLPELVWNMPSMGTINLHASLLPQYRGAAPINWALINGEKETGVTTFKLVHEVDKGNILLQEKINIGPEENAGMVHDRMKQIGAGLLLRTVKGLINKSLKEIPQESIADGMLLKTAPKIKNETARINWNQPGTSIHNLIRGLSPYPGAFTMLSNKILKILGSTFESGVQGSIPGSFETDGKTYFKFSCTDGYVFCREVQLEGKKKMQIEEFLRGFRFERP
ncbi:MAG: methionyl-tRNA formyltransferase [Chitinophagales bacterium]